MSIRILMTLVFSYILIGQLEAADKLSAPEQTVHSYLEIFDPANKKDIPVEKLFTERFLKNLGGKSKIKEIAKKFQAKVEHKVELVNRKDELALVKVSDKKGEHGTIFILKADKKGRYLIDSTMED